MCNWFFFFKQKTAYEMRISDWSSDVCSSDLTCRGCCWDGTPRRIRRNRRPAAGTTCQRRPQPARPSDCALRLQKRAEDSCQAAVRRRQAPPRPGKRAFAAQIGRQSCEERVVQYVYIAGGAVL